MVLQHKTAIDDAWIILESLFQAQLMYPLCKIHLTSLQD